MSQAVAHLDEMTQQNAVLSAGRCLGRPRRGAPKRSLRAFTSSRRFGPCAESSFTAGRARPPCREGCKYPPGDSSRGEF